MAHKASDNFYDDGAEWREWGESGQPKASADFLRGISRVPDDSPVWGYLEARWQEGMDKFGARLLGNPVEHLKEELADAIRYAEKVNIVIDLEMESLMCFLTLWLDALMREQARRDGDNAID